MWKKAWARNQDNGTTHNTPGLVASISRCLQRMEAEWEDAFTICLKDHRKISLIKGEDRKFKHDLRDALRDARLRMITGKDLREDAAKGIDKAASLHLMRSRQLTQWQRRQLRAIHMNGVRTCEALFKTGRLACDVYPACGKEPETQSHMWRCENEQYAVIRKRFMTEKDEEEMRKESMFTQTTLLLLENEELITWNDAHRKEDEVCARTAAKQLRQKLGDDNGETDLQQVSLSLNEEEDSKRQYTVTENGTRLVVLTDGSAFQKDMPLVAAAGAGIAFARRSRANVNFALNAQGGMTNQRGELEACAAVILALDCKL